MIQRESVLFQVCQHRIILNAQQADNTVAAPILCEQANLVGDRILRRLDVQFLTVFIDFAACHMAHAEDCFRRLGAARTDQTRHTQNFTTMQFKRNIFNCAAGRQIFHFKNGFPDRTLYLGKHVVHFASNHQLNNLVYIKVFRAIRSDVFAVAINRDIVRNPEDFVHFVRDINDSNIFFLEFCNNAKQMLDLCIGQRGRRLVHDNNTAVIGYSLGNLNHLHLCNGQVTHLLIRINVQIQLVEQLNAVLPHFFMIDDQSLARCASQPQVFANAALGNRRQLLMDHGNAGIQCLKRIFELDLLAFKYNLAGCRRMNAD